MAEDNACDICGQPKHRHNLDTGVYYCPVARVSFRPRLSTTRPTNDLADELEAAFRGYTFTPADPRGRALDRAITALRGPAISEGEVSLDAEYTLTGRQVAGLGATEQKVERHLIVAWLRKQAKTSGYDHNLSGDQILRWADMLERGDHRITALRSDGLTEGSEG